MPQGPPPPSSFDRMDTPVRLLATQPDTAKRSADSGCWAAPASSAAKDETSSLSASRMGWVDEPTLRPSGASLKPGALFADLCMAASEAYRCICAQTVARPLTSVASLRMGGCGHRGREQPPAQATARNGEANRDPIRVTSAGRGTSSRRPNRQARQRERNDVLRAANQRTNPKQVTVHDTKASYSPDVEECGLIR